MSIATVSLPTGGRASAPPPTPHPAPAPTSAPSTAQSRDAAVDLVRAWCLVVVVVLHAAMVGVSSGADGPVLQNALEHWAGFPALTWVAQVMPLFFLLGGFSGFLQWRRQRETGVSYGGYLASRLRRLLAPAAVALAASALLLAGLTLAGVPREMVATAGFRLSQPLWFLGVYVLCTAALPPLAELHRRAPAVAPLALGILAVGVDVVRATTGSPALGFANLLFVWLLVQQLGFWLVPGALARFGRRALFALGVCSLGALAALCACGVWSFDLVANLNPPTAALVLLGIAQLAAFELLRTRLAALAARAPLARAVNAVNARAMTIYAWHMLALIALTGALLLSGVALPEPLSLDWWLTRPLWLLAVVVAVAVVVALAERVERRRVDAAPTAAHPVTTATTATASTHPARAPITTASALLAAAAGAGGILIVIVAGSTLAGWVLGAALVGAALRIPRRSRAAGPPSR